MNQTSNQTHASALLNKAEVAKKLRCSVRTIDNLMISKSLEVVKIRRSVRFRLEAVVAFINSNSIKSAV